MLPTSHTIQSAGRARQTKNAMKNENYAALVTLDWGETEHAFATQVGESPVETGTMPATPETLHGWLEALHERTGGGLVAIALEGGKSAVVHALLAHPWLVIFPVHPATSDRFRKAFVPSGAKDDVPDAIVLLKILTQHRDQLRPLKLDSAETRKVAALVAARRRAVDERTRLACELGSTLKTYYPQALELCGREPATALALDFLARWPELRSLKAARPTTLLAFYAAHNSRRSDVIDGRLALIAQARALTEDRAVIEPAILQVKMLVDILRPLQKNIALIEERIAEAFDVHPEAALFQGLPGAGPATAPRLLAAFGTDRSRYPNASSLQKYAGIAPVKQKSGRQLWIHWRWNAPKFLRQTFVEWAGQSVPKCAWAKAYYQQQRAAGKHHQATLRALAFKWIRVLWRCWHDRVPYDEARYLASLQRQKSPLATRLAIT
jgi:transposase